MKTVIAIEWHEEYGNWLVIVKHDIYVTRMGKKERLIWEAQAYNRLNNAIDFAKKLMVRYANAYIKIHGKDGKYKSMDSALAMDL